jgi:hypothetical protein
MAEGNRQHADKLDFAKFKRFCDAVRLKSTANVFQ